MKRCDDIINDIYAGRLEFGGAYFWGRVVSNLGGLMRCYTLCIVDRQLFMSLLCDNVCVLESVIFESLTSYASVSSN